MLEEFGHLLLELYAAARALSAAEFPDFALSLLHGVLRFDSARYTTLEFLHPGARVCSAHLHNDAADTVFDWEQINRHDLVIPAVEAAPGQAFNFHQPTHFAGRGLAVMRDYIRRTGHLNNLVIGVPDARGQNESDVWRSLSLYRVHDEDRYDERDQRLLQLLMPHLAEAMRINETLGGSAVQARGAEPQALAIAAANGQLHYAGSRFVELVRRQWPQWPGTALPPAMLDDAFRKGRPGRSDRQLRVQVEPVGALRFVRVREPQVPDRLSPQERRIAMLYGAGRSHKDIARALGLAPATVRNHLQRVYAKLKVNDKAQLAVVMAQRRG